MAEGHNQTFPGSQQVNGRAQSYNASLLTLSTLAAGSSFAAL